MLKLVQKDYEQDAIKFYSMKNYLMCIPLICIYLSTYSQNTNNNSMSFSDTLKKYFDYGKLSQIPCSEVPPGIYSFSFRVDKHNVPYDFQSSTGSLESLNVLFTNAIKTSVNKSRLKKKKKRYLQLIYFNTLLGCNSSSDTAKLSNNLYSDVSKILSFQLSAIETSFKKLISKADKYYILQPASIDDTNPAIKSSGVGFKNDIKLKSVTTKEIEAIEKKIQEAKQNKMKN